MKKILNLFMGLFLLIFTVSCNFGIDPISEVNPGPDAGSPQVTFLFPVEGTAIQDMAIESTIEIKFNVVDDIEIKDIKVYLDNVLVNTFNTFTDYRIYKATFEQTGLLGGPHILKVVATDINGNVTNSVINFEKAPPYQKILASEIFYMPFNDNNFELISITEASKVGTTGYAGQSYSGESGDNSYKGAVDSYLTFPLTSQLGTSFTGMFWYKVNASPDRSGILTIGTAQNEDRNHGFRLFREGSATSQKIKLNVGTGTGESWNDGGLIDVTAGEWVNVAFTVSPTQTAIYLNGVQVHTATMANPVDFTGCTDLSIGSGAPTFIYWDHKSDLSAIDELRFFNVAMTSGEIQTFINTIGSYNPLYGETAYFPFDDNYKDYVSTTLASTVGTPTFAGQAYEGTNSYMGATASYLSFPLAGVFGTEEMSLTFWYKVNADPDRAGIITVGTGIPEDRKHGFRLFREGSATSQRIKLNVGTGAAESWNDGGVIDVTAGAWVHVAITVSTTASKIYLNGLEQINSGGGAGTLASPINWTGCSTIEIGSGAPTFDYWNHLSDLSAIDDLRFYDRTLTQADITAMIP